MTAAIFLDRDGTIIDDVGYLRRPADLRLFPWTVDSLRALSRAGFRVVVVTNQSGIARGLLTEADLHDIHRTLDAALEAGGARIDAYYYCPHHPDGAVKAYACRCECRKPAPGLILRAARDLDIDVARSFVVGDKWKDVGVARAAGARAVRVEAGRTTFGEDDGRGELEADAIVDTLAAAASWILSNR